MENDSERLNRTKTAKWLLTESAEVGGSRFTGTELVWSKDADDKPRLVLHITNLQDTILRQAIANTSLVHQIERLQDEIRRLNKRIDSMSELLQKGSAQKEEGEVALAV